MAATDAELTRNRRGLGAWIGGGWLFFFAVLAITWSVLPADMTSSIRSLAGRFSFAAAHLFLASTLLFLGFLAVGATRWQLETADATVNPAISGAKAADTSVDNRVHTQFLSNTTEQFVMFAAAVMGAAPFLTPAHLRVITLVTVLWMAGRVFFWVGYWYTAARGLPTYPRAVGLGMGLLCTLLMAGIAAAGVCNHYPAFTAILELSVDTGEGILIPATAGLTGSNALPVVLCSLVVGVMGLLAVVPRLAPPVVPIAVVSILGWVYLLVGGVVELR